MQRDVPLARQRTQWTHGLSLLHGSWSCGGKWSLYHGYDWGGMGFGVGGIFAEDGEDMGGALHELRPLEGADHQLCWVWDSREG